MLFVYQIVVTPKNNAWKLRWFYITVNIGVIVGGSISIKTKLRTVLAVTRSRKQQQAADTKRETRRRRGRRQASASTRRGWSCPRTWTWIRSARRWGTACSTSPYPSWQQGARSSTSRCSEVKSRALPLNSEMGRIRVQDKRWAPAACFSASGWAGWDESDSDLLLLQSYSCSSFFFVFATCAQRNTGPLTSFH